MVDQPLPLNFRWRLAGPVMEAVCAGESCALVGVGSSGKSNVMRFLAEPRVQDHYLGDDWQPRLFVMVNGDDLVDYREDNVYELLLYSLQDTVGKRLAQAPDALTWSQFLQNVHSLMGAGGAVRRVFGRAVALLRERQCRLAFLLDDFDEAFMRCDPAVFAGLRALRDAHKHHLVYVAAGRREMARLREPAPRFEAFAELFSHHTFTLGPYDPEDALLMLGRLAARHAYSLAENDAERLAAATGGHAGLLYAAFLGMKAAPALSWPSLLRRLGQDRGIREECQKIVDSLDEAERATLETIVCGLAEPHRARGSLLAKGLILERGPEHYEVFSPLFRDFIQSTSTRQPPPDEYLPPV